MKLKEQILTLVEEKKWSSLPEIIKVHNKTKGKAETKLEEALKELSQSQQNKLWDSIVSYFVEEHVTKYFEEKKNDQSTKVETEEDLFVVESFLTLAIITSESLVEEEEKDVLPPPQKLVQFVVLVGGLMSELNDPVHRLAVHLCELWIKNKLECSEEIHGDTLLAFIEICLGSNAKKNDVKRAWALCDALSALCIRAGDGKSDESDEVIRNLLLSCAKPSLFLNCDEGVKLMSGIFSSPNLATDFHEIVKQSMPCITKAQAVKYSDVYFRTWKKSQGKLKVIIEEKCLQDFMYLAIHADPFASHLSVNLNCFLHHIHKHKKHMQTASTIYSLYEPFLWRSLKVANGYVRNNATVLLCDLFPCTDISLNNEEKEDLKEKQWQAFLALLVDPCHLVRISILKAIFGILSDYWLLIPSHVIQKFFQIFLKKLLLDASSVEVRVLVVKGMSQLLDCRDAVTYMSEVLPHVASAFDDVNASVRIACVKLLLKVKATSFIKYWKLVPLEHLLCRLAEDEITVGRLITDLIHPSFYSPHFDDREMVNRCVDLIQMNREGTRRFYQHASSKIDVATNSRFILSIWRSLYRYSQSANASNSSYNSYLNSTNDSNDSRSSPSVKTKKRRKSRSENKENKGPPRGLVPDDYTKSFANKKDENESSASSSECVLENPEVVGGLLDTIAIIWTVKSKDLALGHNLKYLEAIRKSISRTFHLVWGFFKENEDISKTLLYLSSFLPKSHVPMMVGLCLSRLKAMEEGKEKKDDSSSTYVNALCNWNRFDDVFDLSSDWIDQTFSSVKRTNAHSTPQLSSSKTRIRSARVCFKEKFEPKPFSALRLIDHILLHPLNKVGLLGNRRNLLVTFCEKLSTVQNLLEERMKSEGGAQLSALCSDDFLLHCWSYYLCITALLDNITSRGGEGDERVGEASSQTRSSARTTKRHSLENEDNNMELFDSLSLFKSKLLWMDELISNENFDMTFYCSCAARLIKGSSDLIAIGVADHDFLRHYLEFLEKILSRAPFDMDMWCWSLEGVIHSHKHLRVYGTDEDHLIPEKSITCRVFADAITLLQENEHLTQLDTEKMKRLSEKIEWTIVCLSQDSEQIESFLSSLVVRYVLGDVFRQISLEATKESEMTRLHHLKELAFTLLSAVHKKTRLAQSFIQALQDTIATDGQEHSTVVCGVILLSVLSSDSGRISRHSIKEAIRATDRAMKEISSSPEENSPESVVINTSIKIRANDALERLVQQL